MEKCKKEKKWKPDHNYKENRRTTNNDSAELAHIDEEK